MDSDIQTSLTVNSAAQKDDALGGFFSNILTPGSSLNPTFLLVLDGAFGLLLLVLLSLLILTHGNLHLLFLMIIECCLWASVKWFVHELQQVPVQNGTASTNKTIQGGKVKED
ncbi:hypothetical protein BV20DRAFT_1055649 [Pilatotrama ljubarskyi]|nr:hypothetical protein BV20DRAFT_1055649 [Pilatotrama ljubarskyi]